MADLKRSLTQLLAILILVLLAPFLLIAVSVRAMITFIVELWEMIWH